MECGGGWGIDSGAVFEILECLREEEDGRMGDELALIGLKGGGCFKKALRVCKYGGEQGDKANEGADFASGLTLH